jgi:enamine deaminase RidA (YjgF/YER057c/UK114 family)
MNAETRIAELGLELPSPTSPKGLYRPLLVLEDLAYTSGHVPIDADGCVRRGKVGVDVDQRAAVEAARMAGLGILATVRAELGSLNRVRRVVKVLGLVNCSPEFEQHPAVIDGASQLFADVFGAEAGVGARSAVGAGSLPLGATVEIEAVFQIEP